MTLEMRDCTNHEVAKERHRKCQITMRRAIDHPLIDQFGPNRSKTGDLDSQDLCDIPRAMGILAEFGHRSQKVFFTWSEPFIAHAKKVFVEPGNDRQCRIVNHLQGNGAERVAIKLSRDIIPRKIESAEAPNYTNLYLFIQELEYNRV